ncbi:hypothetical protein [Xanthomonas campestris]|uniref:hypothetical protein n=2 Tax=Xanthomonas campestris TaxID=339 RepID=UPI002B3D66E1|nr:hypothetical protein [Xanthomonas campestris pv. raphani]
MTRRMQAGVFALVALVWSGVAVAGPVQDVTNWLREQFQQLFKDFTEFMKDFGVFLFETGLEFVRVIVDALPAPDFLTQFALCTVLAKAGPWAAWAMSTFHLGEAMALLGTAIVFRLLRVILTAFQWT